jgi:phosphomannomutase
MPKDLVSSISGIRGIVGSGLNPEIIVKYIKAYCDLVKGDKIIVGQDGRITGKMISDIVIATLQFLGYEILDIGLVPTPTVQVAVENFYADGGIAITASHNGIEWNGLKFLSKTGMFLDHEEYSKMMEHFNNPKNNYKAWDKIGTHKIISDFYNIHIKKILDIPFIQTNKISEKKFKIVLDSVNASGSEVIPKLLNKLGCEVIKINCELNGIFPHIPEPLPQNLFELSQKVINEKADIGIAVDPDADRLVLICENGEPFGEEYTITQAIKFILSKKKGNVVINVSSTKAVDDITKKYGGTLIKTPVGEINVAKKMKEVNAVIGGEGSGGVILPDVHLGRDSLVGIALTLQHLVEFNGSLSQLKKSLPEYYMSKNKVELNSLEEASNILDLLIKKHETDNITNIDGLRIDYQNSWIIIRKSNTEPIIRIYSEATTQDDANLLAESFKQKILSLRK